MNHDLDDLLTPTAAPADPALRDRLRAETVRWVKRGRMTKRLAAVAALAACYVGGLVTVWALRSPPATVYVPVPVEVAQKEPDPPADDRRSPRELELAAEQAEGAESARLFLAAARRFAGGSDWSAALRCYRNALDVSDGNVMIDTRDDWWLETLKLARKEEQTHANGND